MSDEAFKPPTNADFMAAWACARAAELGVAPGEQLAPALARVSYAAERARKLLAGLPTCAERDQT